MHASLAITTDDLPVGLTASQALVARQTKGTATFKINPVCMPVEQTESTFWFDDLRLFTKRAGAPGRCVGKDHFALLSARSAAPVVRHVVQFSNQFHFLRPPQAVGTAFWALPSRSNCEILAIVVSAIAVSASWVKKP